MSMLYVSYSQLQLLNILPVVVGWLLTLMTSVVVDFVVVVVGITAITVVVKEVSVPAIHNYRVMTAMYVHLVGSIKKYCACLRPTVRPDIMVFPIWMMSCMMSGLWCTRIHRWT